MHYSTSLIRNVFTHGASSSTLLVPCSRDYLCLTSFNCYFGNPVEYSLSLFLSSPFWISLSPILSHIFPSKSTASYKIRVPVLVFLLHVLVDLCWPLSLWVWWVHNWYCTVSSFVQIYPPVCGTLLFFPLSYNTDYAAPAPTLVQLYIWSTPETRQPSTLSSHFTYVLLEKKKMQAVSRLTMDLQHSKNILFGLYENAARNFPSKNCGIFS